MQGILSFLWAYLGWSLKPMAPNYCNISFILTLFISVKPSILFGSGSVEKKLGIRDVKLRPCVRRFFLKFSFSRVSEIAVFQKLGSERVFRAFSKLVPTCENSSRLVPTLIFAKNCEKTRFFAKIRVVRVGKYEKITNENNKKMTFNSSRLDSRKLVPTRKPTRKFGYKFGMQGPTWKCMPNCTQTHNHTSPSAQVVF